MGGGRGINGVGVVILIIRVRGRRISWGWKRWRCGRRGVWVSGREGFVAGIVVAGGVRVSGCAGIILMSVIIIIARRGDIGGGGGWWVAFGMEGID